jgi:hypothetical protein
MMLLQMLVNPFYEELIVWRVFDDRGDRTYGFDAIGGPA